MPSEVIINADDFGLSLGDNAIIQSAFKAGVISSATLMVNTPGFEQACKMARHPMLRGRIGLHFNITHGSPLSPSIASRRTFCDANGEFDLSLSRLALRLGAKDLAAVLEELQAQWQRCLDYGVRPSHLDSHNHVHNIWPIGEVVARFAARQGVPIRLARNLGANLNLPKRIFKTLFNRRLRTLSGATADYVCTPADLQHAAPPDHGVLEVIVHPMHLEGDFGDDSLEAGCSLTEVLRKRLEGVPKVPYGGARQRLVLTGLEDVRG
ncbi:MULTISPECIES: ChbG/HpnK family deacetylase [unclassified Pseudomonas]|uniref:ChbG/HpnK family deacetylase n=1 Tax=Pseudomonas TaxID=286 RepID=UPI00053735A0|nr:MULTISPECIES: ChbG/HpnK family deacetylase [unclassified Pseudomonas]MBD0686190.1 ChbG/HpnK family deacetylase [Pseudomonas sp. PSB18]CDF95881.1 Cellobiose phosphotransferase system YdjC-like protein [Pseudomonas sp. SHC52]